MNLSLKSLLIIFSIIGISSTFMAWLVYPKLRYPIPGYAADGIITGFAFFLILMLVLFNKKKTSVGKIAQFIIPVFSLLLLLISYDKYSDFVFEKANLNIDNSMIALGTAGYYLGPGIFVLGTSACLIFITWVVQYFKSKTEEPSIKSKFSPYLIAVLSFAAFGIVGYNHFKSDNFKPLEVENSISSKLDSDVMAMGQALKNQDFKTFIEYNHPSAVETFGGNDKYQELISGAISEMKQKGTNIVKVQMGDIIDLQKNGSELQAIITQFVTFNKSGNEVLDTQKLIAISDNGGSKWHYININKKSKAEMLIFFPFINQNLNF